MTRKEILPEFFNPKAVIKLQKWIDIALVVAIISVTLGNIGNYSTYYDTISFYFQMSIDGEAKAKTATIVLMVLGIIFEWIIVYFPFKTLKRVLQLLMQIEVNSR